MTIPSFPEQSFEQWVLALYGKSIYQIELELATAFYLADPYPRSPQAAAADSWTYARTFTAAMQENYKASQPSK